MSRNFNREAELELRALSGDLEAARALGRLEAAYSVTTNLDACPEAAAAYEEARAEVNYAS